MKPILIAVALLAGTFTKSFAAELPAVEPNVLKSFKTTFATATEVGWSTTQDLYKAEFALSGRYVTAYYNADGTMAALTRHISADELPVILQTELRNRYKNQWVSDVFEVTNDNGLSYYATLENADTKVVVKSSSTTWSQYRKLSKD
jgi:hypothetical protein